MFFGMLLQHIRLTYWPPTEPTMVEQWLLHLAARSRVLSRLLWLHFDRILEAHVLCDVKGTQGREHLLSPPPRHLL